MALSVTRVQRLMSGFWRVSFGPHVFAQWAVGCAATREDVFHGDTEAEAYAEAAMQAIAPLCQRCGVLHGTAPCPGIYKGGTC